MKKTLILAILSIAMVQCKKEETPEPTPTPTPTEKHGRLPYAGADAVLEIVLHDGSGDYDYSCYGAFINDATLGNVGQLTLDSKSLEFSAEDSSYTLKYGIQTPTKIGTVKWNLTGSSAFGSFAVTDSATFGKMANVELPESINSSESITVSYTTASATDMHLAFDAPGSEDYVYVEVKAGTSKYTLSNTDVKRLTKNATAPDKFVRVTLMPYNAQKIVKNGKTLYFVKSEQKVERVYIN